MNGVSIGLDHQEKETALVMRKSGFLYCVIKRTFDILVSLISLILLSPVFLLIAILIRIDSKGPSIFKQIRTGRHGKTFYLYKFRSMSIDNDVYDFSKKDQHTRVGKLLRKTSLDELPQLLNILKGDMSLIGPRPWIPDYYENMTIVQRHRCDVRPGLTGLAQCNGRNSLTIFDKIENDLTYVNNCSLMMDIKIIFLTIKIVFFTKHADAGKSTIHNELNDLRNQR